MSGQQTSKGAGQGSPGEAREGRASERQNGSESQQSRGGKRSPAEWITLGISIAIVIGLYGLISYFHFTGPDLPALVDVEPQVDQTFFSSDAYYLPVKVRNRGSQTGEDVRVRVVLVDRQGQREAAELNIQFLAGGATSQGVVAFSGNPREGRVATETRSYLKP